MSLIKPIDMRGNATLRAAVEGIINGRFSRIQWSEEVNLKIRHEAGRAVILITSGEAEVMLKGLPDPNFIKAELHPDHAIVSLSITDVRVNY